MYPVLRGNAAFGGDISPTVIKHLLVEFNCLGVKGTQDIGVVIPAKGYTPIEFKFVKECSTSSFFPYYF